MRMTHRKDKSMITDGFPLVWVFVGLYVLVSIIAGFFHVGDLRKQDRYFEDIPEGDIDCYVSPKHSLIEPWCWFLFPSILVILLALILFSILDW